jgi:hypothetical protein
MEWLERLLPTWFYLLSDRERYEILRDLLSVGMTFLGTVLAVIAIRMGREQTRISKEQTTIAKRQEALDVTQGQIAASQHQIMQEQLSKKGLLAVEAGTSHREFATTDEWTTVELLAVNKGTGTVRGFHWEIQIKHYPHEVMEWHAISGGELGPTNMVPGTGEWSLSGDSDQQIFPKRRHPFIRLHYNHYHLMNKKILLKTILVGEDGEWRQNVEIDVNSMTATYSHDVFI